MVKLVSESAENAFPLQDAPRRRRRTCVQSVGWARFLCPRGALHGARAVVLASRAALAYTF